MAFDSRSCGGCSEMEAAKGSPPSLKGRRVVLKNVLVRKWKSTTCEPRAKPHGKRRPGAQRWRRKKTTPKSANIMNA
jgi:hypothetical protein